MEEKLSDNKAYELLLLEKNNTETRRDEISKYYTSLFTAVVSVMAFVNKITGLEGVEDAKTFSNHQPIRLLLIPLSIMGIVLSISWVMTLKRFHNYLKGIENVLQEIEKKNGVSFISYISHYLAKTNSPDRVTKQIMWVPYTFIVIFLFSLSYSIFWLMR